MTKTTYQVRQVSRGFWTYDIYREGEPPEYSIGECGSRRHAERCAKAAIKAESLPTSADFQAAIGPC